MNKSDIIARLREGASLDDIAAEFSKAMNEAEDEYLAEVEAEKAAEGLEKLKGEKADAIALAVNDYIATFHPEATLEFKSEMFIEAIETAIKLSEDVMWLANHQEKIDEPIKIVNLDRLFKNPFSFWGC